MGHIAYVIDDELHRRAKAAAARKGISLKAWLEEALAEKAERQEADDDKRRRGR